MAIWQKGIGLLVTSTGSYTIPFVISGIAPLLGFFVLLLLWGKTEGQAPADEGMRPAEDAPIPVETSIQAATVGVRAIPPA